MNVSIKENSGIARIAAFKLGSRQVAMVLGGTIHLWNVSEADFMRNERWVKHELCHVRQFKKHGYFLFICKYLWESLQHGYRNNKFEKEAVEAEDQD